MTVALVIAFAAAVAVVLAMAVFTRRSGSRARRAEDRADELTGRLTEAVDLLEEIQSHKRAAEVKASAADGRARAAEQKATDAERRVGDAEKRIADANRKTAEAVNAGAEARSATAVREIERLRVLREWADVVGPGIALPVDWDRGIAAVVAAELSVIRETMGTPSELELATDRQVLDPATAAVAGRAGVELLRRLARSGEEMSVSLDQRALSVAQPLARDENRPDLSDLIEACSSAGMRLVIEEADNSWRVVLDLTRSS